MTRKRKEKIPDDLIGTYYRSRDYNEYLRIIKTEGGTRAGCVSAEYSNDLYSDIMIRIRSVRIDDYSQADSYIMVRDVEGSLAYPYDRISENDYRKGMQNILDELRNMAFSSRI